MCRCKSCDAPLVGIVRYKSGEEFDGLWVEEDMCTHCIYITDTIDYADLRSYQFEDLTEGLKNMVDYHQENE